MDAWQYLLKINETDRMVIWTLWAWAIVIAFSVRGFAIGAFIILSALLILH